MRNEGYEVCLEPLVAASPKYAADNHENEANDCCNVPRHGYDALSLRPRNCVRHELTPSGISFVEGVRPIPIENGRLERWLRASRISARCACLNTCPKARSARSSQRSN